MGEELERIALLPVGVSQREKIAALGGAGIVDQNIEAAEALLHRFDERLWRALATQIGGLIERTAAALLDLADDLLERRLVAPGEHHVAAFLGKRERDAAADAAARSRHQRDLSGLSQVHDSKSMTAFDSRRICPEVPDPLPRSLTALQGRGTHAKSLRQNRARTQSRVDNALQSLP
jgi:hypothetical protein